MGLLSRREIVVGAAAAAVLLGLDRPVAFSASRTQKTKDPKPGVHRFKVGDAECIVLYDGIWEKAHDNAFFKNADIDDTKYALAAAGLRTDFVPIPIMTLVIITAGKLVLCDAGGGGQVQAFNPNSVFVSGKMRSNMLAAGINPAEIETILISHFHPDHIFGLVEPGTDRPVFPNAEIIVPAAEYRWWTDESVIARLPAQRQKLGRRIQAVAPKWKNVLPVEGEDEVVPGIRFVSTPGHTAGHTSFHLSSGNQQLMISNDAIYMPALLAAHPEWQGSYDQDGSLAVESRRKLMDRVIADKMMICGTHFPWPGVGTIAKDGNNYAYGA